MQVFLGDEVTLIKEREPISTYVSGQVSGVVLNDSSQLERIYIHGIDGAFWIHDGWKFIEEEGAEEDEI